MPRSPAKHGVILNVHPYGVKTWKVLASKGPVRGRFVGTIRKKQITVPVKAQVYYAYNTSNSLIGQAFTLRGATKKYEGSIK